ncbi:Phox homologous domain [Pseudocohnilembus persalinus]|uniref:Phox homologous domain n=1 Tax=Pseudocohnilembus persalinus TaxID=266149 RepID=A0A0V0Q9N5_PSEPJ|nr:Phox homologous domain [Pseudocohnilembus persalinus]|eukprot:KRW98874.1 Phox homologous domain [Pseudocohnilembus persalinus]
MDQQNQNPNLQIEVRDPQLAQGVHFYNIKLTDKGNQDMIVVYTQKQRYKVLRELHKELQQSLGDDKLPNFPKKRWFGTTDQQFVSQRLKELQYYFHTLLNQYSIDLQQLAPLKKFLITKAKKTEQPKGKTSEQSPQSQDQKNNQQQNQNNQQQQQQQQQQKEEVQKVKKSPTKPEPQQKMQKILDQINQNFVNLVDNFSPPPEHYSIKKRADYDKLRYEYKNELSAVYQIPKIQQQQSNNLENEEILSFPGGEAQQELIEKMDNLAVQIEKALQLPQTKADSTQIVYKFKSQQ